MRKLINSRLFSRWFILSGFLTILCGSKIYAKEKENMRSMDLLNGRLVIPIIENDFKLDTSALEKTKPAAENFYVIPHRSERFNPRKKALMKTKAWLVVGKEYLVVHFLCLDPDIKNAEKIKIKKRDDTRIWQDDYVDVAIDTNNDKETYFYLAANRGGALWDSACEPPYKVKRSWTSGAQVITSERKNGWTATFRIPLASLGMRPGNGDIISFTCGRGKYFNKTTLKAVLPEDAVVIDYEKKFQKTKMCEESSVTPFAGYNWYFQQRKMYFPANFIEAIVHDKNIKELTTVVSTRGTLRPEKYSWNNRFVALIRNNKKTDREIEASISENGRKIASEKYQLKPGKTAAVNLLYNMKSDDAEYGFEITEGDKIIYSSKYRTLPGQIDLKRSRKSEYYPSLVQKSAPRQDFGGCYWPHQLDYGYKQPPGVRYYNNLGFGVELDHEKLLDGIAGHKLAPIMMWKRPGNYTYNELKYFADVFREKGIKCFLLPHPGLSFDHERKKLFTDDGAKINFPVINHHAYLFHPDAQKRFIANIEDALKNHGDIIYGIYLSDEAEAIYPRMIQDIVWKYKDQYPELAKEIEEEVKNKFGFGKYGVPRHNDKDPFKKLALRRFVSNKMLELGKAVRKAAQKIKPDIVVFSNDDTHGFSWTGVADYKGTFDATLHQLNNFHTMPGKCEAELKYLVDVSDLDVWTFPHIEGWSDPAETNEALSEVFRMGCDGLMTFNVSDIKYNLHDCWNAPGKFAFENQVADLLAEGYRIKLPEKAEVAILLSLDSLRAYHRNRGGEAHTLIGPGTGAWYKFIDEDLLEQNKVNLAKYKVIVVPFGIIVRKKAVEKLVKAAENGATLILVDGCFQYDLDGTSLEKERKKLLGKAVPAKRERLDGKETFLNLISDVNKNTLIPRSITGRPITYYQNIDGKPLIVDNKGRILAFLRPLGKGRVVWFGYNVFNYKDAVNSGWRRLFKKMFTDLGIATDEKIWSFKLRDVSAPSPSEKGLCLTGNTCKWEHNRPRQLQNSPASIRYTYDLFPNALPDIKKTGWISTGKGRLTDRLHRFNDVLGALPPTDNTLGKWVVAWKDVDKTAITFDLEQEWKLEKIQLLFAEYQPDCKISISRDGKDYEIIAETDGQGELSGSLLKTFIFKEQLLNMFSGNTDKTRFVRIDFENIPKNKRIILAEVEIWGDN